MISRRPDLLVLIFALVSTLAVVGAFITDLAFSQKRELSEAEQRVMRFSAMFAEHVSRSLGSLDIVLEDISDDLSTNRQDWPKWPANKSWEYLARHHTRNLPQLHDIAIFDADGQQRAISTLFPTPHINVRDRPYFDALKQGAHAAEYGPFIGRNTSRYTYALSRRIDDAQQGFAGAVRALIEPDYFQGFCWANRLSETFESVIVNANGQIVASCRPSDIHTQSPAVGADAVLILFGGQLRDWLPASGSARHKGLIAAVAPVPGFQDLRVISAASESSLLESWHVRINQLAVLASLITLILLAGSLQVRRQVKDMRNRADELEISREMLEERIRSATAEISTQKEEAERSNRAKSRFLAAASHDLRQPLHALALFATDLQRQIRSGNTSQLGRLSEQISVSINVLGEMLDALLDISRLDVAGIAPEIRAFPLNPLFERLSASFRRAAIDRGQRLVFRQTRLWCESDSAMVERMLGNLISNALRYTPDGGCVLVGARRRGRHILIEVRDNGPGIAPEHREAIFGEFYQIDNPARERSKGLGLGLSIVDRLARALNVEVTLRSEIGRGTIFGLMIAACEPRIEITSETVNDEQLALHFIGDSEGLRAAMGLARNWNHPVSHEPEMYERLPDIRSHMVVVTDEALVEAVREQYPDRVAVVALGNLPERLQNRNTFTLPMPLRPAKLRALLSQLQKELPKSMP